MQISLKSDSLPGEVCFDWLESNTKVVDPDGNLTEAGTCLRLNENILFLKALTEGQLQQLRDSVNRAVEHELSIRK